MRKKPAGSERQSLALPDAEGTNLAGEFTELGTGKGPMLWSAHEAVNVLRFALAAYTSSAADGTGVDPASLN